MPVLVLMVLFVLWAGRTGQARLAADLAAKEAATAAAVCCSPDEVEKREAVVGAVLAGRPELGFLCIHEPRPLDGTERFVSDTALYFDGTGGSVNGVGVLGVGLRVSHRRRRGRAGRHPAGDRDPRTRRGGGATAAAGGRHGRRPAEADDC